MARPPTAIEIAELSIEPWGVCEDVPTGPDSVVPSVFTAYYRLVTPPVSVTLDIVVRRHQPPAVARLHVRGTPTAPVVASVIRQIPVTYLVTAATAKATVTRPRAHDTEPTALSRFSPLGGR